MLRYILRRTLYMVPTVLGVILLTFVLFNMAGGDPALLKLGKNATPKTLEDYDVQRGYNKPLIAGHWGTIRAYTHSDFSLGPGPWKGIENVRHETEPAGHLVLTGPGEYAVPLAFSLYPEQPYRWRVRYRLQAPGRARLVVRQAGGQPVTAELRPCAGFRTATLVFATGARAAGLTCTFVVEQGTLDMASLRLNRRARHLFDSQFWFYLRQLARLDFGVSHETNQRVSTMIKDGIGPSLALTVPVFGVGLFTAITLALVCAFFRNTVVDRLFVVLSVVLMSVNYLVWIVFGQYYLGYIRRWFPVWGFESARYLLLPVLIGVVSGLGANLRFYRTVMLDEMYRDYVRTAFAKGAGRRRVLFRHVLKNAMIPILTSVVMAIPFLYTGSLLLESFFGIPGLGAMAINGLNMSDFDVIRALVFVGAVLYVVANLMTDICYALVDPRVRLQ
ncbi:MAG: ABC transporter permease [Kiritimatiellae bacterium]|nr:ABC transporter permease [Kiritimatiellia bacterium]